MEWEILFESPFGMINIMLIVLNLVISLYYLARLMPVSKSEQLSGMDFGINVILLISFCIFFITFLNQFYDIIRVIKSVAVAGTGDPRVVRAGMIEIMVSFTFNLTCGSFFLIVWFVLRIIHRFKMAKMGNAIE
ncbi:MAG: hypothetical protein JXB48_01840 [Candidatus Latescibacteria bacterium]|nr:hypothetical protein [Candidatus Latescibacterota bacterium]